MKSLKDLYIHELHDLYSAESQIIEALPKMADEARDSRVKGAFMEHLEQTKQQRSRLDRIFDELGEKAKKTSCEGMEGIIKEGESLIKKDKSWFSGDIDDDVMDAALIANAQRVEHYEISGYGTAATYANQLGFTSQASLLRQTLDEENETDRKLTDLAKSSINIQAKH